MAQFKKIERYKINGTRTHSQAADKELLREQDYRTCNELHNTHTNSDQQNLAAAKRAHKHNNWSHQPQPTSSKPNTNEEEAYAQERKCARA